MYQYILFDLDGTLTDPKVGITTCVQYALGKMGIEEPDLDKLEPFIGPPLMDSFCDFYGFDEEQAKKACAFYRERFETIGLYENEIYPGIARLLMRSKEAGKKLAVASSKPTVFVKKILEHFEIAEYFDVVVGSELDGTRGRKEEVVETALMLLVSDRDWKVRSDNEKKSDTKETCDTIAMVGDRKFDVEGAKAFGIISIGVRYGYANEGELEAAGATHIVQTVEELETLLLN